MADLFPTLPLTPVAPRPPQAPRLTQGASPAAIAKAAQDFEAMAISQFLQPMFQTLPTNGAFGGGAGEAAWRPMMIDQIAKQIAAHGGLGLAKPIEEAMRRAQGKSGQ